MTTIEFSPLSSTQIVATPVVAFDSTITFSKFIPKLWRCFLITSPLLSSPITLTKRISFLSLHSFATATAWFAPLPPHLVRNCVPMIVSPAFQKIITKTCFWDPWSSDDQIHIRRPKHVYDRIHDNNQGKRLKEEKCVNRELNPDLYLGRVES